METDADSCERGGYVVTNQIRLSRPNEASTVLRL